MNTFYLLLILLFSSLLGLETDVTTVMTEDSQCSGSGWVTNDTIIYCSNITHFYIDVWDYRGSLYVWKDGGLVHNCVTPCTFSGGIIPLTVHTYSFLVNGSLGSYELEFQGDDHQDMDISITVLFSVIGLAVLIVLLCSAVATIRVARKRESKQKWNLISPI